MPLVVSRRREPVPSELLAIVVRILESESSLGERLGVRASALVAAAGVLVALTVNLGKDVLTSPDLELGSFGRPLFIVCFVLATVLFFTSAVVAALAARPRRLPRVEPALLTGFMENRTPLSDIRRRMYEQAIKALRQQQETNTEKDRYLRSGAVLFVLATLLLAGDASTLAVTQWD
jgi:hypothetical protein